MEIRVEELFHQVADLSADARARYFEEHGVDQGLRQEVEALVAFDADASRFLEGDVGRVAHGALERWRPHDAACGPFRLGRVLGRGGMGTVYLAERADGEIAQRVAVKLLHPEVDDPQLWRRFLAERQILATLSHPHIAQLLDAGHRQDGQPYLAMEYIQGKPVDEYTAPLSVRRKVALFLKVCAAVSYLHRNLVVHRDLKPANILVTEQGEPKLLDFGLAKMLDLNTESAVTNMRMLTPDYASPEQVACGPVTTATDIYSLGAVLYKMLTGESPHRFEGDRAWAIAHVISAGKIVPPAALAPEITRDLEMVLMKALRKEPKERYGTIDQFAEDLENFLASRPIRARRGDLWYRTRKFASRHTLPATAATVALAGLAAGMALAHRERAVAQRRSLDVRQLTKQLMDIDREARKFPGSTGTRQMIVDTSLEQLRRLSADALRDPQLALDVGDAYMRVARVQGVPLSPNLGQMKPAEENLRIAERFIRAALPARSVHRTALLRLAQTEHDRMILARFGGRSGDALDFAQRSARWLEAFRASGEDKAESSAILSTYLNVADELSLARQFDEAMRLCRRGADLARAFDRPSYLSNFLWVSREVHRRQGNPDGRLRALQTTVTMRPAEYGNAEPDANLAR